MIEILVGAGIMALGIFLGAVVATMRDTDDRKDQR